MRPDEGKKRREPRASAAFVFLSPPAASEAMCSAPNLRRMDMQLDSFKTNGSSPPKSDHRPECLLIGSGPLTHNHNPRPDFLVADHGTISLLQPITDRALAWVREHLPPDSPRFGS